MARIEGTDVGDLLIGTRGSDVINGGAGNDFINPLGGNNVINGGAGNDLIRGGPGNDVIRPGGNDGFDRVWASAGNDRIFFSGAKQGGPFDFYELEYRTVSGGITVKLGAKRGTVDKGADGKDKLLAIPTKNTPWDWFGLGIIGTHEDDVFRVKSKAEQYFEFHGLGGDDTFIGGASYDRISYATLGSGVKVMVKASKNGEMRGKVEDQFGDTDKFKRIDSIEGSDTDDLFLGSKGDDRFITRAGNDMVNGGKGHDLVRYDRSGVESVKVDLAKGAAAQVWNDTSDNRMGRYVDTLKKVEEVRGSHGDDVLCGSNRKDTLRGRDGDDVIKGRGGADRLEGDSGRDVLFAGKGADRLNGGFHDGEEDRFVFAKGQGRNVIEDFEVDIDKIDINGGPANFAALSISMNRGDAVISFGGTTIRLEGVTKAELDADDFLF